MDNNSFFPRKNLLWIAIGFAAVILGFALMMGEPSTKEAYNADIFSFRRIVLAPTIAFIGFIGVIFGILKKPSEGNNSKQED